MRLILRIACLRRWLAIWRDQAFIVPAPIDFMCPMDEDGDRRRTLSALTESSPLRLVVRR